MPQEKPRIFVVELATTANLTNVVHNGYTLQSSAMPPVVLTIDGVATTAGLWVLVKNQTDPIQNGLYQVINPGVAGVTNWVIQRTDPAASLSEDELFMVRAGTANANTMWYLNTVNPITAGSTSLVFAQGSVVSNLAEPSSAPAVALVIPVGPITDANNAGSADLAITQTSFNLLATAQNTNSVSIASIILALQNAGILA